MAAERKKVVTGAVTEEDVIVIRDLLKVSVHITSYCVHMLTSLPSSQIYGRRLDGCSLRPAKLAVQGISLTIPRAECFGLLGVNGNACVLVISRGA